MNRYLVTDEGIKILRPGEALYDQTDEYAIFETFEEAALFAIDSLSSRLKELGG